MHPVTNGVVTEAARSLRVIIVGAGFSGTLVAVHLLRQHTSIEIDLVDPSLPGRGLAYSTVYDEHLLNVPAVRMSAFGSEPMHFLDWLRTHGWPSADPGLFAPRKLYGTYLQDVLQTALRSAESNARLRHRMSKAVRLDFNGTSVDVLLRNGERLTGDKVVLALGNPASQDITEPVPGFYSSPWQPGALSGLQPAHTVLLVGSGLTGVDAFLALRSQGHTGTIHMLSRRGKVPQTHASYRPLAEPIALPSGASARELLKAIRRAVTSAQTQNVDWRAVIDSLRPITNNVWRELPLKEQMRVFRHLKTWWDIHRHRMAPEIGAKVQEARKQDQLIVHAGRLRHLHADDSGLQADLLLRTGSSASLHVERVINCTGPNDNYRKIDNPFIRSLLESGYATPGVTGKGLRATAQAEIITADGRHLDWLSVVGPARLGDLLETIAVPELRNQAEAVANRLLSISREPIEVMPELFMAAGI